MGNESSNIPVRNNRRAAPKPSLHNPSVYPNYYPGVYVPPQTYYPGYPNNPYVGYNENYFHTGYYPQTQARTEVPKSSVPSHPDDKHQSKDGNRLGSHGHCHRIHRHTRSVQTTPSLLLGPNDNSIPESRAIPVLLRESSSSSFSTSSLDDRLPPEFGKSSPTVSARKPRSVVDKRYSSPSPTAVRTSLPSKMSKNIPSPVSRPPTNLKKSQAVESHRIKKTFDPIINK